MPSSEVALGRVCAASLRSRLVSTNYCSKCLYVSWLRHAAMDQYTREVKCTSQYDNCCSARALHTALHILSSNLVLSPPPRLKQLYIWNRNRRKEPTMIMFLACQTTASTAVKHNLCLFCALTLTQFTVCMY